MRMTMTTLRRALTLVALGFAGSTFANSTAQTLPFSQNWSNAGLITTNDDWSGVPGIIGYQTAGAVSSTTGTDPQTLLGESATLDVNANVTTCASTFNSGGVTECALPNPTIMVTGSGTASSPNIVLFLDTTGQSNINVAYNLRDVEASADNSAQQFALQYRVGSSGNFTNLPAGYVADATEQTTDTKVTAVSVTLPAAANNQPLVQVRILTTNAVGNDENVGIDDINVTSAAGAGTSFAINDVTMAEGNSGTTNFAFTVTKTGPAAANIDVATADGTAVQPGDYTSRNVTLSFAAGDTTQTFVVPVVGDTTVEGSETFTVGLSNVFPIGAATISDNSGLGTISNDDAAAGMACGDPATLISAVQGSGNTTPLNNQSVQIEGIVVGDFQGSTGLKGFFVQDAGDGNAATSDGIFVFEDTATPANVSVGDRVRVMGTATERFTQTVISGPTTTFCAGGQALPEPTDVNLPFAALDFPERYEGMRVRLPQNLYVTDNFTLGRFGEVVLSSGGRLVNPTQNNLPGTAANAAQAANNLNKILIDDGNSTQNRDPTEFPGTGLTAMNTLRGGERVQGVIGVMSYDFDVYRVQVTAEPLFVAENARVAQPPLPGAAGSFRVASFNVLNYFNGPSFPTSRGADTAAEFSRQRAKIIAAMTAMKADVIGVMEMENDSFAADSALADLVNGLNNAASGGTSYAYVTPAAADLSSGKLGGDEIKVSFIYRTQTASLVGGAKVLNSAVNPQFIDTCNRPTLAQTFQQIGSTTKLTVAVNHFKSKGSACAALNDADAGDGQGNANTTRNRAAQALRDWLATDPTGSGDPDFLIIGDLNSYAKEDPIRTLEASPNGYINLVQRDHGSDPVLSYPFDDQWGTLDYGLANAALAAQVTKAVEWTINGAEPVALDYNVEFKTANHQSTLYSPDAFRSSDHDPVVIEMAAAACEAGTLSFKNAPYSVGESAGTLTVTVQRTGGACGAASVAYATSSSGSGVQATAGSDYTAINGTLNWADNDAADKTFTVAITGDALDEADEIIGLGLANATGAALGNAGTTATITDDDALPTVAFALTGSSFAEDVATGIVSVTVSLDTASGRDVTVPFSVTGTATPGVGSDYTQDTASPLTIPAGQTSRTVQFTIANDTLQEADETIVLTLEDVLNAQKGSNTTHTLTIVDNDAPVQDTTPDAFSFLTRDNVGVSSLVTSEEITITGFTGTLTVTVGSGGQCSVAQGAFAASCPITPGQTLSVRHTAADTASTTKDSVVTIGNTTATFRSITSGNDRVPDAFAFTTQSNVAPGTLIESNAMTLTGFNAAAVITAPSGFEYRINGGGWTSARGSLLPSDTLQLRHTSSSTSLGYTTSTIRVGGVDGSFRTRTRKAQ